MTVLRVIRGVHNPAACEVEAFLKGSGLDDETCRRLKRLHEWSVVYVLAFPRLVRIRIGTAYRLVLNVVLTVAVGAYVLSDVLNGRAAYIAIWVAIICYSAYVAIYWDSWVGRLVSASRRWWTANARLFVRNFCYAGLGVLIFAMIARIRYPRMSIPTSGAVALAVLVGASAVQRIAENLTEAITARARDRSGKVRPRTDRLADYVLDITALTSRRVRGPAAAEADSTIEALTIYANYFENGLASDAVSRVARDRYSLRKSTQAICVRIATRLREIRESAMDAATHDERTAVAEQLKDLLLLTLEGRWSELPDAPPQLRARPVVALARRVGIPALLVGFALLLPHLPGVADTSGIVSIQVGLVVAAGLSLIGAPSETRATITEALNKASPKP